nr:malonate decarboxylase acyl carrier protein [Turicimonas muris]
MSSGDLEVVFESSDGDTLTVIIKSSVDNSAERWKALFSRIQQFNSVPAGRMLINDFGASPGVVRLRVEQVLDEAEHA